MGTIWEVVDSLKSYQCPFKPGQMARIFAIKSTNKENIPDRAKALAESHEIYEKFLPLGFYSEALTVYAYGCATCNACVPVRINARDFHLSASQKALLRRNADLTISITENEADMEHFMLFKKYIRDRHPGGEESHLLPNNFVRDLSLHSHMMEIRNTKGKLVAAAIFDRLNCGLNGYTMYYDPDLSDARRSLGTFLYLNLIKHAQTLGTPHLYIGAWIQGNNKLGYKDKFGLEAFDGQSWQPLNPALHTGGPNLRKVIPITPVP